MNHSIIACSLIIGSIITISNASYVVMPYNSVNSTIPLQKDDIYNEFNTYRIISYIGVLFGLYALVFPNQFKNFKFILPIITLLMLTLTFICTTRLYRAFNSNEPSVLLGELMGAVLGLILGGVFSAPSKFAEKLKSNEPNTSFQKSGFVVEYIMTSLLVVLTIIFTFVSFE